MIWLHQILLILQKIIRWLSAEDVASAKEARSQKRFQSNEIVGILRAVQTDPPSDASVHNDVTPTNLPSDCVVLGLNKMHKVVRQEDSKVNMKRGPHVPSAPLHHHRHLHRWPNSSYQSFRAAASSVRSHWIWVSRSI